MAEYISNSGVTVNTKLIAEAAAETCHKRQSDRVGVWNRGPRTFNSSSTLEAPKTLNSFYFFLLSTFFFVKNHK